MLNKTILMGNMTRDPELRTTSNQVPVASFTLAVERNFKDANGNLVVDFINCVAWRNQAEFVTKYFQKGVRMVLVGSLQTRTYDDKDGNKRTATEVVADEIFFGEKKTSGSGSAAGPAATQEYSSPIPDDADTSLPFDL